jgi:lipoate-protein ligase A
MALDEAILESIIAGSAPPTLRMYAWSPPCLSLGSAQPIEQIDFERLRILGWDIVRRGTGGRSILHTDELTYSIAAPDHDPHFAGGVLRSYKHLSLGLIAALQEIGARVVLQPEVQLDEEERSQPICFELPSSYEITVEGKKLVGSAQIRRRGGVLQHGTIPLHGDISRIVQILPFDNEEERSRAGQRVAQRATTLEGALGRRISWAEMADAMKDGFSQALGITLIHASPTDSEIRRAEGLVREKYQLRSWTTRV